MENTSVSPWWVVLFLVMALGAGAVAILSSGGSLVTGTVLPLL
jgi:F0F1-type ATP synthase assembly protein I